VLPGTALVLVAAAAGARGLLGRGAFLAVVALTIASNAALVSRMLQPMWFDQVRVATGRMRPDAFLTKYSPDRYVFWSQAKTRVPPDGRVAVLEKIPHPYYMDRPVVLLSYLEQGLVDYRRVDTPDALADAVVRLGATHVAVDVKGLDASADPYERTVTALWRGYVARLGEPVLTAGGYALYALPPAPGAARG
jgi:hypothetical protein